jgi:hypothetical protein
MLRSAHVFNILSECAAFAQYFKRMMSMRLIILSPCSACNYLKRMLSMLLIIYAHAQHALKIQNHEYQAQAFQKLVLSPSY